MNLLVFWVRAFWITSKRERERESESELIGLLPKQGFVDLLEERERPL